MPNFHQKPILGRQINWVHSLAHSLVGFWVMNERGGTGIFDSVKNSVMGIFENTPLWSVDSNGSIITVNNANPDAIAIPSNSKITNFGTQLTIIAKVRTDFTQTYGTTCFLIDKSAVNTSGYRVLFHKDIDDLRFRILTSSGAVNCDTQGLTWASGDWHHLVGVYNGSRMYIYHNGELNNSVAQTGNITTNTQDLIFGNDSNVGVSNDEGWLGAIEYIFIYNKALTFAEIQQLYISPYAMFERKPIWLYQIPVATTVAPTTIFPTTIAPTTPSPTTLAPTTIAPTTVAPTTLPPTTIAPTTLPPTTLQPTTVAPTTLPPTTITPTTLAPTTTAPTTIVPTTLVSTTIVPTTVAPTTSIPITTIGPTTSLITTVTPTTAPPHLLHLRRGISNLGFSMRDEWR